MKVKLGELHGRWDTLKSKASQRRQDLEDSLQAQQYFADANEAESWMREKEPIVGSPDYGKDEDSAEVHKTSFVDLLFLKLLNFFIFARVTFIASSFFLFVTNLLSSAGFAQEARGADV